MLLSADSERASVSSSCNTQPGSSGRKRMLLGFLLAQRNPQMKNKKNYLTFFFSDASDVNPSWQ